MLHYVRDLSRRRVPLKRAHRRFRTVRAFADHLAPRSLLEATSDDRRTWASDTMLDKLARGRRRADLADFYEWCRERGIVAPAPNGSPGAGSPVLGATGDLPALPPASPADPGVALEAPLPEEEPEEEEDEAAPLARRVGVALVLSAAGVLWMAAAAMPDRPTQPSQPATSTITAPPPTTAASTTTTTTVRPPSEVSVMAVNGSGVTGRAARVTQMLRAAGYAVVAPQSASRPQPASSVYWTPGYENEARVVGDSLGLPPGAARPLPGSLAAADLQGANVVVVVGPELSPPG